MALVLTALSAGIAGWAYYEFSKADYLVYGFLDKTSWISESGYTVEQFVYFFLATYFFPLAIIFAVSFISVSFHILPRSSVMKLSIYYVLIMLLIIAVAFSYILAQNVLHCISYLCVSSVADSAAADDNGTQGTIKAGEHFIGMLYFFVAIFFVILLSMYVVIVHFNIASGLISSDTDVNGSLKSDPLHPLFPISLLLPSEPSKQADTEIISSQTWRNTTDDGDVDSPLLPHAPLEPRERTDMQSKMTDPSASSSGSFRRAYNYKPTPTKHIIVLAIVLLLFYPFMIFCCCAMPTWWNSFTKTGIQAYQQDRPSQSFGTYWAVTVANGALVLKLFPDIVMYYGVIYLVALVSIVAKIWQPLANFFHYRPLSSWGLAYMSVGDICWGVVVGGLLVGVFVWFYLFHGWEQSSVSSRSNSERAARSMGQVANVVVGLLVLPVTRNSAWTWVLSLSREGIMIYHQVLGYTLLLVIGSHMILWWMVFIENNSFPHDILAVPMDYHADNFTIPLAQVTFLIMLMVYGVLTYSTIRRRYYKIFYYFHLFSLVVFLVMLWHATMSWYFITGGLILWAADWLLRMFNSAAVSVKASLQIALPSTADLKSDEANPNAGAIVKLTYSADALGSDLAFHPGNYMYINIPLISLHDWHPFTLSCSPCDGPTMQHHIKAVGATRSWTSQLSVLAGASSGHLGEIAVNVEGPYGIPWDSAAGPNSIYSRYKRVVMIAGGIGITPIFSAFRQLRHQYMESKMGLCAHLIWVVRSRKEACVFLSQLLPIDGHNGNFTVEIYVTGESNDDTNSGSHSKNHSAPKFQSGRPRIKSLLEAHAALCEAAEMLVYSCGPSGLVDEVAMITAIMGAAFKRDVFEL